MKQKNKKISARFFANKISEFLINIFLPKTNEQKELEAVSVEQILERAEKSEDLGKKNIFSMFSYNDPMVRKMIICMKYWRSEKIAEKFAEILCSEIVERVSEMSLFQNFKNPLIIPIPLSKNRLRKRGFNQAQLLAEKFCDLGGENIFELQTKILKRTRDTPSQTTLQNKKERAENVKGCFIVEKPEKIKERNIILIDDVYTTGSTVGEARRALLEAGAKKVIGITVAH